MKKNLLLSLFAFMLVSLNAQDYRNIKNQRELFFDENEIELEENTKLKLHNPIPREVVLKLDKDNEGNVSCYFTILKDNDTYRMYYNGAHYQSYGVIGVNRKQHPEFTCYAESKDGINWTRPNLGKVEYMGSKNNNIVPIDGKWTHCFTPFIDTNPKCKPDEKYKAVAFCHGIQGLFVFSSPDGINWKMMSEAPVITDGKFDSQNLIYFDNLKNKYVAFYRDSTAEKIRSVKYAETDDFLNWPAGTMINTPNEKRHLYTNATVSYYRAPQYYLGFPMFFNESMLGENNLVIGIGDGGFMSSRDGINFNIFKDAFLRPGLNRDAWFNRCNYASWGMIETTNDYTGKDNKEISLYYSEGYAEGKEVKIRRHTLRLDGFTSIHADSKGGEFATKGVKFTLPDSSYKAEYKENDSYLNFLTIDRNPKIKHFDTYALRFSKPSVLEIDDSSDLGTEATFALTTDILSRGGERRFLSATNQIPSKDNKLFCFHIYLAPKGHEKNSLVRCSYSPIGKAELNGEKFEALYAKSTDHHFAATIKDGQILLYMDGEKVAESPKKDYKNIDFTLGNLRIANDHAPAGLFNRPFIGFMDDVLVLKRAMTAEEIKKLSKEGARKTLDLTKEKGMLFTMEQFPKERNQIYDALVADGAQNAKFPNAKTLGDVMLFINCATTAHGYVKVQLENENNEPYEGFTFDDCDTIITDNTDKLVSWKNRVDLSNLVGKIVKIRFKLKDADIYSYRFGK